MAGKIIKTYVFQVDYFPFEPIYDIQLLSTPNVSVYAALSHSLYQCDHFLFYLTAGFIFWQDRCCADSLSVSPNMPVGDQKHHSAVRWIPAAIGALWRSWKKQHRWRKSHHLQFLLVTMFWSYEDKLIVTCRLHLLFLLQPQIFKNIPWGLKLFGHCCNIWWSSEISPPPRRTCDPLWSSESVWHSCLPAGLSLSQMHEPQCLNLQVKCGFCSYLAEQKGGPLPSAGQGPMFN